MRRHLLLAAAAALVALSLTSGRPAAAAPPDEYGSWWRLQTGTGPVLDPPPNVPEDGVWIASDPSGEQAISAARLAAGDAGRVTTLTLKVAGSTGSPAVRACLVTQGWATARIGSWGSRPAARCDAGQVPGVPATDGKTWSFAVANLTDAASGDLDIALVPATGAGTFSLSFAAPDESSFVAVSPPPSPSPAPSPSGVPEPEVNEAQPASGNDETPSFTPRSAELAGPVFAAPLSGASTEGFDRDVSVDLAEAAEGTTTPVAGGRRTTAAAAGSVDVPPGTRQPLALLAAALLVGVWVWRTRTAVAASAGHPLAGALALAGDPSALRRAESLLTAGEEAATA